ncbi:ABC transporter ATP-binding protein [Brevibacillus choshinensis]|uniref:ABC transporter ATP-binding protein n=1 Tax=Brevibacillus choshinensis TaxID=54911 RepID=A0ABX7FTA3_BRECH|nr:dipeptide/oligopeptide/nickel ABC transporter ATP-binding protein [Brevibacillus choshinensis]QRG69468.1 ABC transporter ATP-binding protein [Brevibacillus choshinensis]
MEKLVSVEGVCKSYGKRANGVSALQDVTFHILAGECVGVVGESGSGKSTLSRIVLGLEKPDQGKVFCMGTSLFEKEGCAMRELRQHIQVVFQDPTSSLNQRIPIWRSVLEPLDNFPLVVPPILADVRHSRRETAQKLLEIVGLEEQHLDRYPHELSGGQRQRVAIARGISLGPRLLICDEPTSSLDVYMQAQILRLLQELKEKLGMSYLFISHDLAAVRMLSDRMMIIQNGRIVDQFESRDLYSPQRHPYTQQLIAVVS